LEKKVPVRRTGAYRQQKPLIIIIIILKHNLVLEYASYSLVHHTIEITSLGFISDITDFCSSNLVTEKMPDLVVQALFRSVISSSYSIYCWEMQSRSELWGPALISLVINSSEPDNLNW